MKSCLALFFALGTSLLMAQTPRLVVPVGHTGAVKTVVWSPDGKMILTGSEDGTSKLWDLRGHEIQTFEGEAVAFWPDGNAILTFHKGERKLWDLSGREIQTFEGKPVAFAFSGDGKALITGGIESPVQLWDLNNQSVNLSQTYNKSFIMPIVFSPDLKSMLSFGFKDPTSVRLFDLDGQEIRQFNGHSRMVVTAAFSPDGKNLLTGSNQEGMIILWNVADGRVIRKFQAGTYFTSLKVAFSPDGKQVMASGNGILKFWDLENGREIRKLDATAIAFSPDGKFELIGYADGTASIYDQNKRAIQTFSGHVDPGFEALAFSPDGKTVLMGADKTVKLWDLTRSTLRTYNGHTSRISSVAFSPANPEGPAGQKPLILTGSWDGTVKLWDPNGALLETFGLGADVNAVAFSPDGQSVLAGGGGMRMDTADYKAKLWDVNGQVIQTFKGYRDGVTAVAFSPDGKKVLTGAGSFDGSVTLWDLKGVGKQIFKNTKSIAGINSVAFSPDGQSILVGAAFTARLLNSNGQEIRSFESSARFNDSRLYGGLTYFNLAQVVFSPDGNAILSKADKAAKLFDLQGNLIKTFEGHKATISCAAISSDQKKLLTGSDDRTAKLWDLVSGEELATILLVDSADWIVTTPSGLFDASPNALKLMYYVQGSEVIELDQLKERYYEPDLLARIMGLAEGELRKVENLNTEMEALYPLPQEVVVNGNTINVRLQQRSGGIGKAVVLLDGDIELIADANPGRQESFQIDLAPYAKHFVNGQVRGLSLVFYNAAGRLPGPPYPVSESAPLEKGNTGNPAAPGVPDPNANRDEALANTLYALVVGTSDYTGDGIDLEFSAQDALAFRDALKLAGAALFDSRMDIRLLNTTPGGTRPTLQAIRNALFDIAARAEPKDILLIYFSGHGITWPENNADGQFYYLTAENSSFDFNNPQNRRQALGQDSLQEWVNNIPARKRILILDACNSGAIVDKLENGVKGKLDIDQQRALRSMKNRSGLFVLASSPADKVSYEDKRFGHGLLTYSLLRCMPKVASANEHRYVDVGKLFAEVREDVPKLAGEQGKNQDPKLIGTEDYSIGIIRDNTAFKLPSEKKIISKAFFSNNIRKDPLNLSNAVNRELEVLLNTQGSPFAFWDVDKAPGLYYSLTGEYEVSANSLMVTAYFSRSDQDNALKTFKSTGPSGKVKELAANVTDQLVKYLNEMK